MRTLAVDDPGVCQSVLSVMRADVQKQLNGSRGSWLHMKHCITWESASSTTRGGASMRFLPKKLWPHCAASLEVKKDGHVEIDCKNSLTSPHLEYARNRDQRIVIFMTSVGLHRVLYYGSSLNWSDVAFTVHCCNFVIHQARK